ncbi:calcium-binding protein [Nocardioides nitrophenolicus]|uniref:calcium-binding protein n=1 Tax=Nocardioides nitrophenolicus TaxID=60489 RepID=UPI00195AEE38|nr:calcium-binding protein [Nocardioides nitrophenolicus]MBM7519695.1 Ca2+-binding RTX toxin-like protein [Nocardioides nitrophenolicus]
MHARISLTLAAIVAATVVPLSTGGAGAAAAARPSCGGVRATIVGTPRADVIRGTRGRDVIVGLGGNDRILGRGGADLICGGGGADTIRSGTSGRARLYGNGGNDDITANGRGDKVSGGAGNDEMRTGTAPGVVVRGDLGDDRVVTESAGATVYGGAGHDVLTAKAGGVALLGEDGDDQLFGADVPGRADGGPGNDLIVLGSGDDVRVHGGPGSDRLLGGGGDDRLDGDDGVDECQGGPGTDTCHGGAPGGPENSPDDPDVCAADVEVKISCHSEALPSRWTLALEGTSNYSNGTNYTSEVSWVVSVDVEQYLRQDGVSWFFTAPTGVTGSWTGTAQNGECRIAGSGEFADGDLGVTLALDEVSHKYTFEWGGVVLREPGRISCPWGDSDYQLSTRAADRVAYEEWDPADLTAPLQGGRTVRPDGPGSETVVSYTYRLAPTPEQAP